MRDISIRNLIEKSMGRTTAILLRPFQLKKWLALILIAALAGALGGGMGIPGNFANLPENSEEQGLTAPQTGVGQTGETQEMATGPEQAQDEKMPVPEARPETVFTEDIANEEAAAPVPPFVAFLLGAFVVAFSILVIWLGSRFKFIWFEAVVTSDAAIRNPFSKYGSPGNSLFKVWLVAMLCFAVIASLVVLIFMFFANLAGTLGAGFNWMSLNAVLFAGLPILLGIMSLFILAVLITFVDDFVVTIMALDSSCFLAAWKNFVPLFKDNARDFWRYILVKLGLGLAAWIFQMILLAGWVIVIFLTGLVLFGIPYFFLIVLFKAEVIFTIFSVLLGIPFFILAFISLLALGLPFSVFFRSFSLYFLSSLKTSYTPLPLE